MVLAEWLGVDTGAKCGGHCMYHTRGNLCHGYAVNCYTMPAVRYPPLRTHSLGHTRACSCREMCVCGLVVVVVAIQMVV